MIAVSVIVPVYNAAQHLRPSVESLLIQTLKSCEFIFVNDGSTDESLAILEDFQKADDRIVIISQENKGVSAARNAGLSAARGSYIGFADADDTVAPALFATLLDAAQTNNADIVVSRYILHQNGSQSLSPDYFNDGRIFDRDGIQRNIIPFIIGNEGLNAIWTKLYRRALIRDHQITFPLGIALGEDGLFNLEAFFRAHTVYCLDYAGYHYHVVPGSATRNFAAKDYYRPLVEEYSRDYTRYASQNLSPEKIEGLKSTKFLKKSLALINEYSNPANGLKRRQAYQNVAAIVNDGVFIKVLNENRDRNSDGKSRYERFILWAARHKSVSLLLLAATYSRARNN